MKKQMDEFMNEVARKIRKRLGSGYKVEWNVYYKNNGVPRIGLVISDGVNTASPCIFMDGYYALYREQKDMGLVVGDIIRTYKDNGGWDFPLEIILDREHMLDNVLFKLVNTDKNERMLHEAPHYNLAELGLSMVFYMPFQTREEGIMATAFVDNGLMKAWDSSQEELLEHARKNTPKKMRVFLCSILDILREHTSVDVGQAPHPEVFGEIPAYVLSNEQKLYGAGSILYEGVLERAAEQFKSGFYILPSSVHEVILLPSDRKKMFNTESLKGMVAEINRSGEVSDDEVLSDEVYYYDRDRQKLAVAG